MPVTNPLSDQSPRVATFAKEVTYSDTTIIISQIICYILTMIPLRLRYRAKRIYPGNLHLLRKGSLILSNHQSMVDPFFVVMNLPFRVYLRILPMRFPTADHIMKNPTLNPPFFPILKFLGCFSVGTTADTAVASIFYIREVLKSGKTIILFPEGKIVTEKTLGEFKRGINFFMQDCTNIMFVRLRGFNEMRKWFYKKGEHSITFGRVLEPPPEMTVPEMRDYLERM